MQYILTSTTFKSTFRRGFASFLILLQLNFLMNNIWDLQATWSHVKIIISSNVNVGINHAKHEETPFNVL